MGALKYIVLLATIVVAVSAWNPPPDTRDCTHCPMCDGNSEYNSPLENVCEYCHCAPGGVPIRMKCPVGEAFNIQTGECEPSDRCGKVDPRCESKCNQCYHDIKFNSTDPCGYCECQVDGSMVYHECPEGMGWEHYECVPKEQCSNNPLCNSLDWKPCFIDMGIKFPSSDPCGYCEVTSNGMEYHHCPAGTGYEHYECVPKDECCKPNSCANVECPPCYHGMGLRFPDPDNSCGFCCCRPSSDPYKEVAVQEDCPPETYFDPEKNTCVYQENLVCRKKEECCNECSQYECPPCYHGMGIRFPNPYNTCGFCCCESVNGSNYEIAQPTDCPDGTAFDPEQNNCVYQENLVCHKKDCHPTPHTLPDITTPMICPTPPPNCAVTCPPEHYGERWLIENPVNPCSFCCCEPDGTGREIPHYRSCWEEDQYFDPISKVCRRNATICPRPPFHYPDNCRIPSDKDGCHLVVSMCAIDDDGHLPNPYDDRSFCQCDHLNIHWMPCPPGTVRFVDSEGACV